MARGSSVVFLALFFVFPLPPMPHDQPQEFGELIFESDIPWDVNSWNDLVEQGVVPLRQLSANEMLVWGPIEKGEIPPKITEYRGLVGEFETYIVILEPRLEVNEKDEIKTGLNMIGLNPITIFSPMQGSPLSEIIQITPSNEFGNWWQFVEIMHGIHWVEPVLETVGRNDIAAAIMQHGNITGQPAWLFGLDGTGVIITNADSGIDRDHACFREATEPGASGSEWNNATGTPGINHRKIVFFNGTVDDWDSPNNQNYRHGTHVAGSLACRSIWEVSAENNGDWINATPGEGTSIAHGARLVIEDVVDDDGWQIPNIGELFWEASSHGSVIRSDSWGDDSTEYTLRTSKFDAWLFSVPWSVSFVAPGNTGDEVLEPANGLNVVSVGAAAKDGTNDLWTLSPRQETAQGRMGVTIVVPGETVISAKGDGVHDSNNDGWRSSTGTSMATPQAAAFAAIIQQMVETGWVAGNESQRVVSSDSLRPDWAESIDNNLTDGNLSLAQGFTPSGPLIRALMVLSADSLEGGRQAELTLGAAPDNQQGWGRPNISNLVDFEILNDQMNGSTVDPAANIWIHDSFRMTDNNWKGMIENWVDESPLDSVSNHNWKGEGATGPFLSTTENVIWKMPIVDGEDLDARLVWNSAPNIDSRDDLDLIVTLPDGQIFLGNDLGGEGLKENIETIEGVHIPSEILSGLEFVEIEINAHQINIGPENGGVGLNGDKIGFALAVKGVERSAVETLTPWLVITQNEMENEEQGGDSLSKYWFLVMIIIILFATGLIIVERHKITTQLMVEEINSEGEPSNHDSGSLPLAVAPHIGDNDE
uniref:Peptidase S8/S53 subtilisin kexin sedolisin n=1 Tax=uncultured marine group II/III euryarchaeote AD1000_114_C07 TaxID=1457719 RepID=A0A075FNK0_9EURY|nr:peptidase S8/S53 subtilisin kexin sedolisin [uncultured marine group II/III euryarchaeote AD1000_114_C07]